MKKNEHSQHLIMRTVKDYGDRCNFERDVNDYLEEGYKVVAVKIAGSYDEHYQNNICHVVVVVEKPNKLD